MTRLLIVEDEKIQSEEIRKLLTRKGWDVDVAGSVPEATRKLAESSFAVVLADERLSGAPGSTLINHCGKARVVMMSAHYGSLDDGSVNDAVDRMKLGAVDYVRKPIDHDDLVVRLERAAAPTAPQVIAGMLPGDNVRMREVREMVCKVAVTDLSVLLLGEAGTGKRLVARAVHQQSSRRAGPFVIFRCAALDEDLAPSELFGHEAGAVRWTTEGRAGLFESANGGTVFLDEVSKLPPLAQERLLQVLQEREVRRLGAAEAQRIDVRVITATKADLRALVGEQKFNNSLFFRLQDFEIPLPPLRERGADVLLLARRALEEECVRHGRSPVALSPDARAALLAYPWPGNMLELEAALRRALVLCDDREIATRHLPEHVIQRSLHKPHAVDEHIRRTILAYQDTHTEEELADMLGFHTDTLRRCRERLGLLRPTKKPRSIPPKSTPSIPLKTPPRKP